MGAVEEMKEDQRTLRRCEQKIKMVKGNIKRRKKLKESKKVKFWKKLKMKSMKEKCRKQYLGGKTWKELIEMKKTGWKGKKDEI